MRHPVQRLAYDKAKRTVFLAAGDKIQGFDADTGSRLQQWSTDMIPRDPSGKEQEGRPKKKSKSDSDKSERNSIRTLTCTDDGQYLVATTDEKKLLLVLSTVDFSLVNNRYDY